MDAIQIGMLIFLIIVLAVGYVELQGRQKIINRQHEEIKILELRVSIRDKALQAEKKKKPVEWWTPYLSKAEIMQRKDWNESQFFTMMWALTREGYAKKKGKGRDTTYSLRGRDL